MTERREELDALLVQRATEGLGPDESRRLNQLLIEHPGVDKEWVDRLVGEVDAEWAAGSETPLSEGLRAALVAAGPEPDDAPDEARPAPTGPSIGRLTSWAGWAAAAAIAFLAFGPLRGNDDRVPTFAEVVALEDVVRAEWQPGGDDFGAEVAGEVVWSPGAQSGVMRFSGLSANDPSDAQYQLWIFAEGRDDRFPVDGGVFDIPDGLDVVDVPIMATLEVGAPTLFAVTVERPGGVVVSSRERMATIAQVSE
ncbi:MAG: anti-sigma factor [Gemmatimonadota bacterium]